MQTVGQLIRDARTQLGLSLRALASHLGVTPAFLNHVEHGRSPLPERLVPPLAQALHLDPTRLREAAFLARAPESLRQKLAPAPRFPCLREAVLAHAHEPDRLRDALAASGGKDSVIWLWEMEKSSSDPLGFHKGPVMSLAFSPDGKLLASASTDRTVVLWDIKGRQRMSAPLQGHGDDLSVAFSPDGRQLVSSAEDGSINRWELSMPTWLSRACRVVGRNFTADEWRRFFGDQQSWWRQLFGDQQFRVTCPGATAGEADARVLAGDSAEAERLFDEALRGALRTKDAAANNQVCWLGSINGFAKMVKPACEQAVELAPEASKGNYRDSRGLARALTGDSVGAIEDFTAMVDFIKDLGALGGYDLVLGRREEWIAALKERRNPFNDAALLKRPRTE